MQRERLTITLDTELLAAVDTTIDHSRIRNRSHAIEHAIREGLALQDLTTVVITGSSEQLPELLASLSQLSIEEYIVIASDEAVATSLASLTAAKVSRVPADFGSGAALLLIQEKLTSSFLYINTANLQLPVRIVPAYAFHRHNNGIVTHIVHAHDDGFSLSGISLLQPEVLQYISSGPTSLEDITFPNLAKAGTVMTYVCN